MKKIIFDLDDTLYASKELRELREQEILKLVGNKVDDYEKLRKTNTTTQSILKLGIPRERLFEALNSVDVPLKKDKLLINVLKNLKENYELVVMSNSPSLAVRKTLNKLGISNLISDTYSAEDFPRSKPAEECFFMVSKGDVCVGNNFDKDLAIPKKMGAITIYLGKEPHPDAHASIKTVYEIESALEKVV